MGAAVGQLGIAALRAAEHDAVAAAVARLDDRVDEVGALHAGVVLGARGGREPVAGVGHLGLDLADDDVDPVPEQAVPGLLQQEPADAR